MEEWIWIAASIIAGLIIFSLAYNQIVQMNVAITEQKSLEQFEEIANIVNNLCWSFAGNKREYRVALSENVEGIYAAKTPYEKYRREELIDYILLPQNSFGNYLCIQITNKRTKCKELDCNTSIPFIGSVPEKFSLSMLVNKLMGKGKVSEYLLHFIRETDQVSIFYDAISQPQALCGNNVIDKGEKCEPPNSLNNNYCSQSISFCDYSKRRYCSRDNLGNCNSACQCSEDPWICGSPSDNTYCNSCPNHCGDGECNCGEDSSTCPSDCGFQQECNIDEVIKEISKNSVYEFVSHLASKPRPAEGWEVDTSWNKETRDWLKRKLEEFGLKNVRIQEFSYNGYKGYNVVGELGEGNQIVIIGSHRDSCGNHPYCQLTQGAVDNAAGSSVTLELARAFSKKCGNKFKNYKFIFSFFDSEELGLLGSISYVQFTDTSNVKAMINFDCPLSFFKQDGIIAERTSLEMDNAIDYCITKLNVNLYSKSSNICGYSCSDHWPFRNIGIATFFPVGAPSLCGEYYHTPGDKPETVKKENLEMAAKFGACVILRLYGR